MKTLLTVPGLVAALLLPAQAWAQDKTGEIDTIFSWATPNAPGCVVAVAEHGKLVVNRAYGSADLERDVPLRPGSIFDAGSLRKQFVAASVLLLVEEGRLALSDDVHKHIPELPDYGNTITLDHLLTHTSGLRDWPGLRTATAGSRTCCSATIAAVAAPCSPRLAISSYGSDELKAVIRMAPGKGGLMGRINDSPGDGVEFKPVDLDTFQMGMLTIRLRRDTAGEIVSLDFTNPVLRNIRFTRLSDGTNGR